MACDVAEERLGEVVYELDVGTVGTDTQVDGVMHRRHVAVDEGICLSTVIGNGLDVNLFQFLVPTGMGIEHTHAPLFELEVADLQVGSGSELAEERGGCRTSCGLAAELYGMEIHEVEDIVDFYLVEIHGEGIGIVVGGYTVDDDMLGASVHGEMVYEQTVFGIDDVGGLQVPGGIAEDDMRGEHTHMGLRLVEQVAVELDDGIEIATHVLLGAVVVPLERGVDLVVGGIRLQTESHPVAVVHDLLQAEITLEGICRRGDVEVAIGIPGAVIGKGGQVACEVDEPCVVVDDGIEGDGLSEYEIDTQEAPQPVGLAHDEPHGEVVGGGTAHGWQTWQGGEFGAYEVDEGLWQCGVVELSAQFGIGKVTLQ